MRIDPHDQCNVASRSVCCVIVMVIIGPTFAHADDLLERVIFADEDQEVRQVEGRVLVEALDGGLLVEGRDARLWTVTPDRLKKRAATQSSFRPFTAGELAEQLQDEFGRRFKVTQTEHYVICSNAGEEYTSWCGSLFERLWKGFERHWQDDELPLSDPETPLAAIVFANARQFAAYARKDEGPSLSTAKGYYSIRSNRIVLYDLTAGQKKRRIRSALDVNKRMAAVEFNVATVVHEATHQIAFNRAVHTRYADNPLWLTEGMAMYFETPDLKSRDGWRTAGSINQGRLEQFRRTLRRRKFGAIERLIGNDDRFRNPKLATDAYAESWALTHFLIKTRREAYVAYLGQLAQKPRLVWDNQEARIEQFQAAFGADLAQLNREFLAYVEQLR